MTADTSNPCRQRRWSAPGQRKRQRR